MRGHYKWNVIASSKGKRYGMACSLHFKTWEMPSSRSRQNNIELEISYSITRVVMRCWRNKSWTPSSSIHLKRYLLSLVEVARPTHLGLHKLTSTHPFHSHSHSFFSFQNHQTCLSKSPPNHPQLLRRSSIPRPQHLSQPSSSCTPRWQRAGRGVAIVEMPSLWLKRSSLPRRRLCGWRTQGSRESEFTDDDLHCQSFLFFFAVVREDVRLGSDRCGADGGTQQTHSARILSGSRIYRRLSRQRLMGWVL